VTRILCAGLATVDLVYRVGRIPGVDEKAQATGFAVAAGGPAANAAVTAAALGASVTLVTAIGRHPLGALIRDDLTSFGIRIIDATPNSPEPPPVSAITVLDGTGERSVVSRNAEDVLVSVPADLPALTRRTGVVLIDGHHPALAVAAARAAGTAGIPVVLDGGSAKPVYAELVPLADAMVCSASVDGLPEAFATVAEELLAAGVRVVAMTAGGAPVRWRTREATGAIEIPRVTVCDTLGAGDVLHGAFAFARAKGIVDPDRSLSFGVAVASLRVQHVGPRSWLTDPRLPRCNP